ncbi:MAG: glycosyltransferase family 4 protein [Victivallales bacterium]|nr:glycosyltransferase family 4 protein [Victivallales bacterium]
MSRILLLYHYFHPSQVVSSRLFSHLAEDLVSAGHEVTVFTGNRVFRSYANLLRRETWHGVNIRRFSFPCTRQGWSIGRLANSAVLQMKWTHAVKKDSFDVVILGTDPQFSYLMFPFLRWKLPQAKLIHWVFDLYPEAVLVNFPAWIVWFAQCFKWIAAWAYRRVNVMVDIGSCMRKRLQGYHHKAEERTLTPWAVQENDSLPPVDPGIRKELFGNAKLALLYSGTIGYAHDIHPFIELARECRKRNLDVGFCFAGYGNKYQQQTACLTEEDTNIRLASFLREGELLPRLASADIHLISLRENWDGIVVPSKCFGAFATGRPVLFSGPEDCSLTQYCRDYDIGFQFDRNHIPEVADRLANLLQHPEKLTEMQQRALQTYQEHFSRKVIVSQWLELLKDTTPTQK